MNNMKKTKIIATIWPATDSREKIKALYEAWVNVIRFNFSHWNYKYFEEIIKIIKELNKSWETRLSFLLDTKWPEIRTKDTEKVVYLEEGEEFIFTTLSNEDNIDIGGKNVIVADYEEIVSDLNIWNIIVLDDGLLRVEVIEKNTWELICKALNSHKISARRHINLPWIKINLPWITKKDKEDISFWIEHNFDFIALSFVRNKKNILELKNFLKEKKANIKIISKIESEQAIENIDDIIEFSDWIMIARGDLWVELPAESLPVFQKTIAKKCRIAWKFFIVATQMLESMIINRVPTRAEVNDIFYACEQEADCTMLSGETAAWKYPIESVEHMTKIIKFAESSIEYKHDYFFRNLWDDDYRKQMVKSAVLLSEEISASAILVFTDTGFMAKTISAFRPKLPVFAFSFEKKTLCFLNILFGIISLKLEKKSNIENVQNWLKLLKEKNLITPWDRLIVIYDRKEGDIFIPSIEIREI